MSAQVVLDEYLRVINKHEFALLEPLISDDCKFWFSSGTYNGLPAAKQAFEKTWNLIQNETYSVSEVEWICEGDRSAVCTYVFHWVGDINGEPRHGKGRGTSCFRLEETKWKLVHEHLSQFPS
jgi:ketosteroid isomerase-like protein